jgi:hypothetical protein
MSIAEEQCRAFEKQRNERSTWEDHWQQVARMIFPEMSGAFFGSTQTKGERRDQRVFDSTAALALDRYASIKTSMLNPSNQRWHTLTPGDDALLKDKDTAIWYEEATKILFRERYHPRACFDTTVWGLYKAEGAFGNGVFYIDRVDGINRYVPCSLANTFIERNYLGVVDKIRRSFKWTLRKIAQRFGEDELPERWKKELRETPDTEKEIIHCVMPREDYDRERIDDRGKPFTSYYIGVETKVLLEEGGYHTFPYIFGSEAISPGEEYGRGPAMTVLGDINMVNEMSRTVLRAGHRAVAPPLAVHDDGILGNRGGAKVRMTPDAVNYGAIDDNGRLLVQPIHTGANPGIGEDMIESRRRVINDAFLITLFQILIETPEMTATEALIRAQEKGMLITPTIERQRHQVHAPTIEREIDLLARAGVLPPPTPAMIEAEGAYEVHYQSPLDRMQDSEELVGIQRTIEMITPIAQYEPTVVQVFDFEEIARTAARINGAPARMVKSPEQLQAENAEQQEAVQTQELINSAGPVAGAMKDVAQAQKLSREAGIA